MQHEMCKLFSIEPILLNKRVFNVCQTPTHKCQISTTD